MQRRTDRPRSLRRLALVGLILATPVVTAGCQIPLTENCTLLLFEPSTQFGLSCNF